MDVDEIKKAILRLDVNFFDDESKRFIKNVSLTKKQAKTLYRLLRVSQFPNNWALHRFLRFFVFCRPYFEYQAQFRSIFYAWQREFLARCNINPVRNGDDAMYDRLCGWLGGYPVNGDNTAYMSPVSKFEC